MQRRRPRPLSWRLEKAANAFEAATTLQPTFVEAYTYWGNALQEMKDMPASAKVFSDAI